MPRSWACGPLKSRGFRTSSPRPRVDAKIGACSDFSPRNQGNSMAERAEAGMDLVTLPHHVEFLSERWLEEAGRFFREALPGHKAKLGGKGFSLSERFTDAPPHL